VCGVLDLRDRLRSERLTAALEARAPAGVTVTVLPTPAFTSSMRACTAFSDSSITEASAIDRARIAVIEMLRMVLRNAFFTPLVVTLIPSEWRSHP
jgi:hypothetical protein